MQKEPHGRSLPRLGFDPEMAARLLAEVEDHAETKAAPGTRGLGGEERLHHALDQFRRHADAGIGHRQHDIVAGRYLGVRRLRRHAGVRGLDQDLSAMRHRVPRVDREIEQGVSHLRRIRPHRPQVRGQLSIDTDRFA